MLQTDYESFFEHSSPVKTIYTTCKAFYEEHTKLKYCVSIYSAEFSFWWNPMGWCAGSIGMERQVFL